LHNRPRESESVITSSNS